MTAGLKRVANLVGQGTEEHTYLFVPDDAVGEGFASVPFELGMRIGFLSQLDQAIAGIAYVEAGLRAAREG